MQSVTATIDANNASAKSGELTLTDETLFTLYVLHSTGSNNNHRLAIELSPVSTGDVWVADSESLLGAGHMTLTAVAARARIGVIETEGGDSVTTATLLASN